VQTGCPLCALHVPWPPHVTPAQLPPVAPLVDEALDVVVTLVVALVGVDVLACPPVPPPP
jgi:hypothetical protein